MEFNQLVCFLHVANAEHVTRAAEQLHMTQPAVSRTIARLEEDLGCRLFEREGRNVKLSSQGKVVLEYATNILNSVSDMRAELKAVDDGTVGTIRIGSSYFAIEPNWLQQHVRVFSLERPNVKFSVHQYSSSELMNALETREIDLAISTLPLVSGNIVWKTLFTEKMGVIMSSENPLAKEETLSINQLSGERFFCNNANADSKEHTKLFCQMAGFNPDIHFECEFPSFIGESISKNRGVSFISERGYKSSADMNANGQENNTIVFKYLKEEFCTRECGVAYLKNRPFASAIKAFRDYLLDV